MNRKLMNHKLNKLMNHKLNKLMNRKSEINTDTIPKAEGNDGVVSVRGDPVLQLHTTRSWDFLDSNLGMRPNTNSILKHQHSSSDDIIIGVIDTGMS
ncbi:hypothetical protein P8452_74669 [Trifolium repens]|nr:hypothetical protein P8452_74669 [Trifolium repens]